MSLFSFLSISPQFAYQSSHIASEKWSHMGEGLKGTILHALDMVLGYFGAFCEFFAMKSCFQRPFSSISCIFNSSKHLPIAKKWQFQPEGVLTNCNLAKSDGKVFSQRLMLHNQKSNFLVNFSSFWYLWASYEY